MFDLLVAGAGYVGGAVARFYASKGLKVAGLVRSDESADALSADCIFPVIADITRPETLADFPSAKKIFISVSAGKRGGENYRDIYVNGTGNLLTALKLIQPEKLIYISSTGVYGDHHGEWVDETTTPSAGSEREIILLEAERQILNSGIPSVIFRLGGIYGPGRNRIEAVKEGIWIPKDSPDRFINLIHLQDIVRAMDLLFEKAKPGEIYLGVDDEPVKEAEYYNWLITRLDIPSRAFLPVSAATLGKRCRNAKLKSFGFNFMYPNFKTGYEAILKKENLA